eukprot:11227999-Lingulodinium_polyedra.AAC.1
MGCVSCRVSMHCARGPARGLGGGCLQGDDWQEPFCEAGHFAHDVRADGEQARGQLVPAHVGRPHMPVGAR